MPAPERPALLILGGTAEAVALADALMDAWGTEYQVITSLAGRTRTPRQPRGRVRTGGFGGAESLARYLVTHEVRVMIDATHPFARGISENARRAGANAGVPRLALLRPPWEPGPGDDWRLFSNLNAVAAELPGAGRRVFLTVGRTELAAFRDCRETRFLVRMIDSPDVSLPVPSSEVITGRGPFDVESEKGLMTEHKIDVLVCKASGGSATRAKLDAARELGLPVLMVARPDPPAGPCVADIDAALAWVREQVT
ncbi:MAG: cobalt-precorrin-6A reductase [Rhodospirillaceae bacterium]|nr:cobalt-precorrin-6A reductase [Rhodospirillaceae bacterium]